MAQLPLSLFFILRPSPRDGVAHSSVGLCTSIDLIKKIVHRHAHRPASSRQFLIKNLLPGDSRVCRVGRNSTELTLTAPVRRAISTEPVSIISRPRLQRIVTRNSRIRSVKVNKWIENDQILGFVVNKASKIMKFTQDKLYFSGF